LTVNLERRLDRRHRALLEIIRGKVNDIWQAPQHKDFTDHKPEGHSRRIIAILNSLCSEMMEKKDKRLSIQEIFILLASAYLHDIGMQYNKNPKLTLIRNRDRHHLLSEKMILGSARNPHKWPRLEIPDEYVEEIAKVSKGHRKTDLWSQECDTVVKGTGDGSIRLRLLTALLALADDLDITFERVIMGNLNLREVPQESRMRWWLCHYVDGVEIRGGWICIHFTLPARSYKDLVASAVESQLENSLKKFRSFLWDYDIRLYLGDSKFRYSTVKESMSEEDLDFLRRNLPKLSGASQLRIEHEKSEYLRKAQEPIGLNAEYRRYEIVLQDSRETLGILEGEILYSAIIKNETSETKPLFQDGKVCDGQTTIPQPLLSKIPSDAEDIASFEGLRIDGEAVSFRKQFKFLDSTRKELGITRIVLCDSTVAPKHKCAVSYTEKFLFDRVDTFTRRFRYLSLGVVEVSARHPSGVQPSVSWLSTPFELNLRTSERTISPTHTIFSADGRWMPGEGFVLMWREDK